MSTKDIETKIKEAQEILKALGLPEHQQNKISALTFLALCGLKPNNSWSNSVRKSLTLSKGIMDFVNHYYADYKANSRESFRKIALKPFVDYNIVELNPDNPTLKSTSSNTHYAISFLVLNTVLKYGTNEWDSALEYFKKIQSDSTRDEKINSIFINKIEISNFKSIVKDTIELGRLNIFIGANGSGKSNILESVATIGAAKADDLNFDGLYGRGVRIARPDLILSSFLKDTQKSSIDISLSLNGNGMDYEFKTSLIPDRQNDIYTKWIDLLERDYSSIIQNYITDTNFDNSNLSPQEILKELNALMLTKGLKKDRKYDNLITDYLIYDLNTKTLRGITPADSRKTPLGLNGEGLDLLIASFNKKEKEYLNKCSTFFDWLEEIGSDKDEELKLSGLKAGKSLSTLYFKDRYMKKQNNTFSAENSNEGILHVLFYLALFISNKTPKIFAIDNIETALNPKLCEIVISELASLAKLTGKQALITTHNPAILDGLDLNDDEQRLFEVFRNDEGHTQTRRIKFKPNVGDKKFKLSEMWMKGTIGAIPLNF